MLEVSVDDARAAEHPLSSKSSVDLRFVRSFNQNKDTWIPAFAGMTDSRITESSSRSLRLISH